MAQVTPEDIAEGEEIEFEEQREDWRTYQLKDGTTLQIKTVLVKVRRLKKWNPDGEPMYIVATQNIVKAVNIPKELRAKRKEQTFKPV